MENNVKMTLLDFIISAYDEMVNSGKLDRARASEMLRILQFDDADCGKFGKAFELITAPQRSYKKGVSAQNKNDVYIKVDGKRVAVEVKTNGGRIGSLYKKGAPKYTIYAAAFTTCPKGISKKTGKPYEPKDYVLAPILIKTEDFLRVIEEIGCKTWREHAGLNDGEWGINSNPVKLVKRLQEYPIPYDRHATYTSDDFEDLEF